MYKEQGAGGAIYMRRGTAACRWEHGCKKAGAHVVHGSSAACGSKGGYGRIVVHGCKGMGHRFECIERKRGGGRVGNWSAIARHWRGGRGFT